MLHLGTFDALAERMGRLRRSTQIALALITVVTTAVIGALTNLLTGLVPQPWVGRFLLPLAFGLVLAILLTTALGVVSAHRHSPAEPGPEQFGAIAVASSNSGLIELFAVTTDGGLLARTYQEPGTWSSWRDLGSPMPVVDVDSMASAADRTECIIADTAGHVWWTTLANNRPTRWARLSGDPAVGRVTAVAAISGSPGRCELYVVGEHGKVARADRWHNGSWSPWEQANSPAPCRDVALSAPKNDLLECFTVGIDGRIRHRWSWHPYTEWSAWCDDVTSDRVPVAVALDALNGWPDHQEIFVVQPDGGVAHRDHWQGNTWPDWRDLDPPTTIKKIATGTTSTGRLEVIAVDRIGRLWQRSYADGTWWSEWREIPAPQRLTVRVVANTTASP